MSQVVCTQPDCSGRILDGYCDVCGMPGQSLGATAVRHTSSAAPKAPQAPSGPSTPSTGPGHSATARTGVSTGSCDRPGCAGTIVDGYCDVCGSPPGSAPLPDPASSGTAGSGTGSHRIEAAAIGSARATGTAATRRTRTSSTRMRAARIGAGLTSVAPAPSIDPTTAVMARAEVPENKRVCPSCGSQVGRTIDGRPGRTEGFCPACRAPYSFAPKLAAGDLVAGQYAIVGALAHGGLGWIYLAKDRNVSDRWVVLKGLLNAGDSDALAAAIAEQQFLAQVEHPLIVEIYNFVTHEGAGYIVMEYVGGISLKDILKQRMRDNGGTYDPLPVDQALAYILEVLPAFSYLHDLGLAYCDFKPDNLIQVGDGIKLIDLGGVRRIDDDDSAIYGTLGYQAPEVAAQGTSVASDIYTIGRTLLVLCMEFRGYQGRYLHTLPDPATTALFTEHDSLYWLIAKCCAPDPADRFASVDELRTQLLGVLREVVAADGDGTALTSASSLLFHTPTVSGARLDWSRLPTLRPDPTDSQHAWVTSVSDDDPQTRLANLASAPATSAEVHLARAEAFLALGEARQAHLVANAMLAEDPWEWRALWISGLGALQRGAWGEARAAFNAVYQQVPGELAPKLALAYACELGGQGEVAEALYRTCARTDASYVAPAAFGMARVRAQRGDPSGTVEALDLVPPTSRGYPDSRRLRAVALLGGAGDDLAVLDQAMDSLDAARIDPLERYGYAARILRRALDIVARTGPSEQRVGSHRASEPALRAALEQTYREMARDTTDTTARVALVNQANAVRAWTLT